MSCKCASEAVRCMPKPGVADLCCETAVSCCEPGVTLDSIPAAVVAWWDENGSLDGAPNDTGADSTTIDAWIALLQQYTTAIGLAHEKLGQVACMAHYAATCCVKVGICIDAPCCCTCACNACPTCDREAIRLDKMCVLPERVKDVTLDGVSVYQNDAASQVDWCDGVWRLYGPRTGTFELCFELEDPSLQWLEAVKSFACDRVPCQHAKGCDNETQFVTIQIDDRDRQFVNNQFADDLIRDCCAPTVTFGNPRRPVRYVRWGDCE